MRGNTHTNGVRELPTEQQQQQQQWKSLPISFQSLFACANILLTPIQIVRSAQVSIRHRFRWYFFFFLTIPCESVWACEKRLLWLHSHLPAYGINIYIWLLGNGMMIITIPLTSFMFISIFIWFTFFIIFIWFDLILFFVCLFEASFSFYLHFRCVRSSFCLFGMVWLIYTSILLYMRYFSESFPCCWECGECELVSTTVCVYYAFLQQFALLSFFILETWHC